MKNLIPCWLRLGVQWFRSTRRIHPSRAREQAVMTFTPEQLRAMLLEMLSEPETRRLLLPHLASVFPVQGGMPCTAGTIPKFASGSCTDLTDSVITESSGKIGIGTPSPGAKLEANGNIATDLTPFLRTQGSMIYGEGKGNRRCRRAGTRKRR